MEKRCQGSLAELKNKLALTFKFLHSIYKELPLGINSHKTENVDIVRSAVYALRLCNICKPFNL